ncbi:sugar ABC transporter ATP-binding protein [Pseudomonas citronellolis]|uniref:sugar ABC transporter ATP-binding protein n=1 Tax=Pseudomonas citronellolis TaxID=53408 RepID=UPI00209E6031|nr:sugar ABC transporter ATP-binding protein [Pseudomonas citronellolis]MCP1606016.1 ribose transport system ATP-binding protein [Pseudomonas citronellolis]MCP1656574.1 ribose transport system ATP-binding protein [Pseudomonas citronellolis]MCP1723603.1 ribose transport system ATP-binding protein [Pseudomonas citronellolis]
MTDIAPAGLMPEASMATPIPTGDAFTSPVGTPLLSLRGIVKQFPGVRALDGARLDLWPGEVHVLFGENGAGKSTLINVIAGVHSPDEGELLLNGQPLRLGSVQEARRHGIAAMFQEFSLAPHLTVAQNLVLGNEPARCGVILGRRARDVARRALAQHSFDLPLEAVVGDLGRAEQQMVEMAKALLTEPRILILDEPTASLSERETEALFETIRQLKARGVAIVYITHRMREIRAIADRITVMRDGSYVASLPVIQASEEQLIELMTGRKQGDLYPSIQHYSGRSLLRLDGVCSTEGNLQAIELEVREGEIVGLAGLVGCGKSEIGRACFGLTSLGAGAIHFNGEHLTQLTPRAMLARGLGYITSDRRNEGLLLQRSTRENIALAALPLRSFSWAGLLRLGREKRQTHSLAERMRLRPLQLDAQAVNYSGGNQQKIVIARALARETKLLIVDEPTVGVDVGARAEIYKALADLVHEGCSILLISSDMPEILNLSHRVYVVKDGRIVDHLEHHEIDEERILHGFFHEPSQPRQGQSI